MEAGLIYFRKTCSLTNDKIGIKSKILYKVYHQINLICLIMKSFTVRAGEGISEP